MSTVQTESKDDVAYDAFSQMIRAHFATFAGSPLFTTDAVGLFDAFLAGLPAEYRQHYTCHACRKFVETFGALVSIDAKGRIHPVVWPVKVPELFKTSVASMRKIISASSVTGVFLHGSHVWGTPVTGEWHHMSIVDAPVFLHPLKTPRQMMSEKAEDYKVLCRSLEEFNKPVVEQAVTLLKGDALLRSDRFLGVAVWFLKLHQTLPVANSAAKEKARNNLIWVAVATAPNGYCHIRNTVIGTLLDDLINGYDFLTVAARFTAMVNPANYQRPQTAPTVGNVEQAEKIIARLGLENSLKRRYLSMEEIPEFVWRPHGSKRPITSGGIFDGIPTKQPATPQPSLNVPIVTMTWDKFQRTVLPTAANIEIEAKDPAHFAALVTAVYPDSPSLFQWSNPVSWYYHGGVDAEIRRRVEYAGGQYEGCEIRCSLSWENYTDLDLHCEGPGGHIYYRDKRDHFGGWLDVDANGGSPQTTAPVENIRWINAPVGNYHFYIHNYAERGDRNNLYKTEIEVNGKVFTFEGHIGGTNNVVDLASFHYQKGVVPAIHGTTVPAGPAWNLAMNQFYPVSAIVKSPNLWGDNPVAHAGNHTFFLIGGCEDTERGRGRAFFAEMLKPELREIRKTLDAYTAYTEIEAGNGSPACGLGYSGNGEWGVTLRVTNGSVSSIYNIDRMD